MNIKGTFSLTLAVVAIASSTTHARADAVDNYMGLVRQSPMPYDELYEARHKLALADAPLLVREYRKLDPSLVRERKQVLEALAPFRHFEVFELLLEVMRSAPSGEPLVPEVYAAQALTRVWRPAGPMYENRIQKLKIELQARESAALVLLVRAEQDQLRLHGR